jgi:hypothetical protein
VSEVGGASESLILRCLNFWPENSLVSQINRLGAKFNAIGGLIVQFLLRRG